METNEDNNPIERSLKKQIELQDRYIEIQKEYIDELKKIIVNMIGHMTEQKEQ